MQEYKIFILKRFEMIFYNNWGFYELQRIFNWINKYYKETIFLKEKDEIVKNSRLLLFDSIKIVLENGTSILGIKTVDKL